MKMKKKMATMMTNATKEYQKIKEDVLRDNKVK